MRKSKSTAYPSLPKSNDGYHRLADNDVMTKLSSPVDSPHAGSRDAARLSSSSLSSSNSRNLGKHSTSRSSVSTVDSNSKTAAEKGEHQVLVRRSSVIERWVPPKETLWFILIAFLAQSFRGFGPGFSRYLQKTAGFESLELVSVRNGAAVVLLAPYVFYKMRLRVFLLKNLWVLVLAWAPAQIASFYSAQFTYSYYLKLIDLTTPFFVAIIARGFLKKSLPPYTLPAMIVAALGAATSLSGQLMNGDQLTFVNEDLLGMGLGFTSAFCVACGLVFYQTVETKFPSEAIFWLQNLSVFCITFPLSMGVDPSWAETWRGLTTQDGIILFLQILFFMIGLMLQIIAIRGLGAPLVSTVMAWGFVVALLFGMSPLLNEQVNTLNIVGALIVTVTVTAYLVYQYLLSKRVKTLAHYESLPNAVAAESPSKSPLSTSSGSGGNDYGSMHSDDSNSSHSTHMR